MKIGIITDTHYGTRSDNSIFYEYQKKSNEYFFSKFDEAGIKHVIHLGDMTDRRKYLNYVTGKRLQDDLLTPLSKYESHIIAGNHDVYYKNTNDINSLDALVDKNQHNTYTIATEIEIEGNKILLVPWINTENYDESIETIKNSKALICLGHLEIIGFELMMGIKSEHGLDFDVFKKFDIVGSGHFHHRSHYKPVHYVGAAYEFTWSDHTAKRGVSILDTDTMEFEFIQNPYSIFNAVFYDDSKGTEDIQKQIDNIDSQKLKDSYVKIFVNHKNLPYSFDMLLDKIYDAEPCDIKIQDNTIMETDETIEADIKMLNTNDFMKEYVETLNLNDGIKKDVNQLMADLYKEAVDLENME